MKVTAQFYNLFFQYIFFKDKPLINITSIDHCYVQENTNIKDGRKTSVLVFDALKEAYQYISSYEIQHTLQFSVYYSRVDFGKTGIKTMFYYFLIRILKQK